MTMLDNQDRSSLIIISGDDRIEVDLKRLKSKQQEFDAFTSIIIEMDGYEIEVRRVQKTTTKRSISVHPHVDNRDRQSRVDEKLKRSSSQWDYSLLHGPKMWFQMFPQLQYKRFQSPIQIYTDLSAYEPALTRRPFIFEISESCCQTLENTGHSFQVSGDGYSYITRGPVVDEYEFLQLHMHWGANDNEGSEHVIDGVRFPAELHIVTWNITKYKTPQQAIASEKFGALMVFAVLIKAVPNDNFYFIKLFDLLSKITNKGEKINLGSDTVSIRDLMPENINKYYMYEGSLTTPMCNESVRWIVLHDKVGISRRQLNQLRQLKTTCKAETTVNGHITQNFRPLMPLNGRTVYRSFP